MRAIKQWNNLPYGVETTVFKPRLVAICLEWSENSCPGTGIGLENGACGLEMENGLLTVISVNSLAK